jgi:hypothetical protein
MPVDTYSRDVGLKELRVARRMSMANDSRTPISSQPVRTGNGRAQRTVGTDSRGVVAPRDPEDTARRSTLNAEENESSDQPLLGKPKEPESKEPLEPLTISLPTPLIRQARIVVVALGTTMSKLVTGMLEEAVARELPAIVAELSGARRAAK